MAKRHWMVDLETLGKQDGAALLSIGLWEMFPETKTVAESGHHILVDPTTCQRHGLHLDASTVLWWFAQSDEARSVHVDEKGNSKGMTLQSALCVVEEVVTGGDPEASVAIWGNGATFDNVLLRGAFNRADILPPWMFWNDRCYRTLAATFKDVPRVQPEVAHDAMYDAKAQAIHLMRIADKHNLTLD